MKSFLYTLFTVCFLQGVAWAQSFTQQADTYFTKEEYAQLIKEGALNVARSANFPESVFAEEYDKHQQQITALATPVIIKKFNWLENGYSTTPAPQSAAWKKRKESYTKELLRGVRDALYANEAFLKTIFTIDESDRIVSFHSDITVEKDGALQVTETIKIYNGEGGNNDEIKRGVVREFPTRYKTKTGLVSTVPFHLISATKNGEREFYKWENAENGVRYYFGTASEFLERGYYTYVLSYQTSRQIIFHNDKDELYWNVNGTGWSFTSGKVSCRITFPEGAKINENNCYTGVQGSTDSDCNFKIISSNVVEFSTTQLLNANEGLTVSTTIQKGMITAPTPLQSAWALLKDNYILPALAIAIFFLFVINFTAWWRVGRDPEAGTIIPQFEPPQDFSPADCGFLLKQTYSAPLFAASIVDYAVHRLVDIEVKREGLILKTPVYYFNRPAHIRGEFERDYKRYKWYGYDIEDLFGQKAAKGEYNSLIASRYSSLHTQLKNRMQISSGTTNSFRGLFSLNDGYIGLGIFYLFLCGFGTMIYFIVYGGTPVLVASAILLLLLGVVLQILFSRWMSAYTKEGRKLLDHVLGFKRYLETAEQKMFDALNPPEMTIQLFEKYLPYAIALGCENKWAAKFEAIINQAIEGGYQPVYYRMQGSSFSASSFASGISSGISSTIASATTPPSSSSGGSGGGGSSGGGGGGGGGGGW